MRDPSRCDEHLEFSRNILEGIIAKALWAKNHDPASVHRLYPPATDAAFRRKELDSWRQAARGEEIGVSFLSIFKAFTFTELFARVGNIPAFRLEFVLPLLGARALEAGKDFGYVSRLSLIREDERPQPQARVQKLNHNWDCGIFLGSPVVDFDNPTRKLQVKAKRPKGGAGENHRPSYYERAGIASIYANRYDLKNLTFIKKVCLAELKAAGQDPNEPGRTVHGSSELDRITKKLYVRYQEPIPDHDISAD